MQSIAILDAVILIAWPELHMAFVTMTPRSRADHAGGAHHPGARRSRWSPLWRTGMSVERQRIRNASSI